MKRVSVILLVGIVQAVGHARADDLEKELPRIPALEPAAALKSFKIHPGFRLHLAASEPLVAGPVSACFDADGRLYVVEMRGYPYPEKSPTGNVRLLEDVDGDGTFDRSTIFLDGLSWPTGVVPYDGGVFIAVAPDILYAKDTNGDGVADVKRTMFTGFGTQNVQALVNGLLWGPDGWIYGVSGGNGGEIVNKAHPNARPVSVRGRDFRFRPDGSEFEAISGGGQFGHAFDDWGHRFTCNNSNHIRQIVLSEAALARNPSIAGASVIADIAMEGPAAKVFRISLPEPWRLVRTRQRAADPEMRKRLPPTELFAAGFFTSATGVTIYRGGAYPTEFRGDAFIGDVGGNLVHRKHLRPKGAIFEAARADRDVEFLASTDNWFRPVNFANTPSGTLMVLDMYRETIEHPASIPEPIKAHLDLTSGRDRGRLYEILPNEFTRRAKPGLSRAKTSELVSLLADRDAWWRETAQRLLIERRDPDAEPILRKLVASRPNALGRAHAMWTLSALGKLSEEDVALSLTDSDARVREVAVSLVAGWKKLGENLDHVISKMADDPDAMVRFQVALAPLDDEHRNPLFDEQLHILEHNAADPWTRLAVYSGCMQGRGFRLLHSVTLSSELARKPVGRAIVGELAEMVGAGGKPSFIDGTIAIAANDSVDARTSRAIVRGLGHGLRRHGAALAPILEKVKARYNTDAMFARAARDAVGEGDAADRIEAIKLLEFGPKDSCLDVLLSLLDARQPAGIQLAALQTLSGLDDTRVASGIIERWKGLGPEARREASEVLLSRGERAKALLEAIDAGQLSMIDIDSGRRRSLLAHPDSAIRDRAAKLLAGDANADRKRVINQFRPALRLEGDRERGRGVYRKSCASCHRAEGQGENVGPDLATVAGRTPEELLIHILDPSREVPPQFMNYNVATTDGRIMTGVIAGESANAVTLKRGGDVTEVVPRATIEAISSSGRSLMPEGLETGLTPADFSDLIAFIRGISSDSSAAPPR